MTLTDLVARFGDVKVLVLGDVMLDRFVYGKVARISPEGPIPVLAINHETLMAGGAGNVARNISALGGQVTIIGLIGDDMAGRDLTASLASAPGVTPALVTWPGARTIQKTRYVAQGQQLLRADLDGDKPDEAACAALLAVYRQHLPQADIVILSDYGKGVLSEAVLRDAIAAARVAGKLVIADPKHHDVSRYDGVTLITPNAAEAALASGVAVHSDAAAEAAAEAILSRGPAIAAVLITRGPDGMCLAQRGDKAAHIPSAAREVFDVSGAGDTVVATLALGLGAGADYATAARAANLAAGIAVGKVGTATVDFDELSGAEHAIQVKSAEDKVFTLKRAVEEARRWRRSGERVGFTNGCFDLLHPGHVSLLTRARNECNRLFVGLNSDASVKRLKGEMRPVQTEMARAIVLASLGCVDGVIIFEEDTPLELISALRPDVLVKGADYRVDQVVGADIVQSYGGRVVLADLVDGQSTSRIVSRMAVKK